MSKIKKNPIDLKLKRGKYIWSSIFKGIVSYYLYLIS
jgi:hypothetical protein